MEFYNQLSDDYDLMTRFNQRMAKERPVFESLNKQYNFKHALDAGCGSGFHSILLASLGLTVTGIDNSTKMLELASRNARSHRVSVEFIEADFLIFPEKVHNSYDAIFCLGNSLAHLLTKKDLNKVAGNFRNVLLPGGRLIIQLLNYTQILNSRERIVGITEHEDKTFIRFYDFEENSLQFNILTITKSVSAFSHQLISTQLYPWRFSELQDTLQDHGFNHLQFFSDLNQNEFDEEVSKNLVVIAQ